jgi:hypothetical protein
MDDGAPMTAAKAGWREPSDRPDITESIQPPAPMTREEAVNRLRATEEYLNDILDAHEAWKHAVDHGPGSGITDPDYPGPSNEECEAHDEEVGTRWNDLEDALDAALAARQEP